MIIKIETESHHLFEYDIDWQSGEGELIDNRKMGGEYVHHCYVSIICPKCHKMIDRVDVYEYSEGVFNYAEGFYAQK